MKKKILYVGITFSWLLGAVIASGVVALNGISENNYGWIYITGVILIMEALFLLYLYTSIFFQYRKGEKELKASNKMINLCKYESSPQENNDNTNNYPKVEAAEISLRTNIDSSGLKYTKSNNSPAISENNTRSTQMSAKERGLLKSCVAVAICFFLSYMPGGIVLSFVLPPTPGEIQPWLKSFTIVSSFCGSLWNPFL